MKIRDVARLSALNSLCGSARQIRTYKVGAGYSPFDLLVIRWNMLPFQDFKGIKNHVTGLLKNWLN